MLNELHGLAKALSGADILVKQWHREYLTLPKVRPNAPCFRIWVGGSGDIPGFNCLSQELVACLRKYGNKHGTFPAFNAAPLYRLTDESHIRELEQFLKKPETLDVARIKSWCTDNNWASITGKIALGMVGKATELAAKIKGVFPDETNAVTALLEALETFPGDRVEAFRQALEKRIVMQLQSGEDVPAALTLLFHPGNPAKAPKDDHGSLSVILDYAGWREYGDPVASESLTEWINEVLLRAAPVASFESGPDAADGAVDAFGEPLGQFKDEPMPEVSIPGLAGVRLRSMFNQVRCQQRYGRFDGASFPASMKTRADAKAALEYISSPDKQGKTWKQVDAREIVFAYPSILSQKADALDWLAPVAPPMDDSENRARFEYCAEDFIRAFSALSAACKPDNIRIFFLRKMDKARTKVVFSRNTTPQAYIDCAEFWQRGCANIPQFREITPVTPFPIQVAVLCNDVWKRNGERASTPRSRIERVQYYQGMELFADTEGTQNIVYFLHLVLQNCQGVFSFSGNAWHAGNSVRALVSGKLSRLVPLLGLLLYKGGYTKETYMHSAGYLMGQLLKLSDELHAMYCRFKRKGEIPPQLVGNSVFITASETPVKALALLGQRLPPYLAWAGQFSRQEQEKKWEKEKCQKYLQLYGDVAGQLEKVLERVAIFDEFERAQVFLGYLAALPGQEKSSGNEQENIKEEQGNE